MAHTLTPAYSTNDLSAGTLRQMRLMGAPIGVVTEADAVQAIVDAALSAAPAGAASPTQSDAGSGKS